MLRVEKSYYAKSVAPCAPITVQVAHLCEEGEEVTVCLVGDWLAFPLLTWSSSTATYTDAHMHPPHQINTYIHNCGTGATSANERVSKYSGLFFWSRRRGKGERVSAKGICVNPLSPKNHWPCLGHGERVWRDYGEGMSYTHFCFRATEGGGHLSISSFQSITLHLERLVVSVTIAGMRVWRTEQSYGMSRPNTPFFLKEVTLPLLIHFFSFTQKRTVKCLCSGGEYYIRTVEKIWT